MRNIVTHEVYEKHIKEKISRVFALNGTNTSMWNIHIWSEEALWENNSVKLIPGCGGKKGDTIITAGVQTIATLKSKSDADLHLLQQSTTGISFVTLQKWHSTPSSPGSSPGENKENLTYPNPYLEEYGADEW